jgi:hypothetical protein
MGMCHVQPIRQAAAIVEHLSKPVELQSVDRKRLLTFATLAGPYPLIAASFQSLDDPLRRHGRI